MVFDPGGMRMFHKTLRNQLFVLPDPFRPFDSPVSCGRCKGEGLPEVHLGKTYHLDLDDQGACIVSFGVLERIRPLLDSAGFTMENLVANPPTQTVGG